MPTFLPSRPSVLIALFAASLSAQDAPSLLEARKGHETKIVEERIYDYELETPPPDVFRLVSYEGEAGTLHAYVGQPKIGTEPGSKLPAILWITGGFPPGGADSSMWDDDPELENEQTAQAYRHAGVVMVYPTVRGSFGNDGQTESFYGEVNDILSALRYVQQLDYVDSKRIYLGGHSTGGTLALLTAAATDEFAGVIALGPVEDPAEYGPEQVNYDVRDKQERLLRAPIHHLPAIRCPTLVVEGEYGNVESLRTLRRASDNDLIRFVEVSDGDHFNVIAPVNDLLAKRLVEQSGAAALEISSDECNAALAEALQTSQEAEDLWSLSRVRQRGVSMREIVPLKFSIIIWFDDEEVADLRREMRAVAKSVGGVLADTETGIDDEGDRFWKVSVVRKLRPMDLDSVFEVSAAVAQVGRKLDLYYDGLSID